MKNGFIEVSIIIVNYKTPKLCIDCIKSLKEHSTGFSYEIIVIDNNSQDESISLIGSYFGDEVKLVPNMENLGTAKAYNQGARLAQGQYLFYLNSDTLFVNNAIKMQLELIKSKTNIAVVGGNLFNSQMRPTHSFVRKYFDLKKVKHRSTFFGTIWYKLFKRIQNSEFNYSKKELIVDYICAAATLIRKDVFDKIGGFDERIFMYGEEALLAYRFKEQGYISVNTPKSKIIHFEGDSFDKDKNDISVVRIRRFYTGTTIALREIYGDQGLKLYLDYQVKMLNNKAKIAALLRKKNKVMKYETEMQVLKTMTLSI